MTQFALTPEHADMCKAVFAQFAAAQTMTRAELTSFFVSLGFQMTTLDVDEVLSRADSDKNGVLSFSEFLNVMMAFCKEVDGARALKDAFAVFDANGDGRISLQELRHVLVHFGADFDEAYADELLSEAGLCAQGGVSYRDFVSFVCR